MRWRIGTEPAACGLINFFVKLSRVMRRLISWCTDYPLSAGRRTYRRKPLQLPFLQRAPKVGQSILSLLKGGSVSKSGVKTSLPWPER